MSDSDGDMDMYPDNDIEFAGENLVSKLSPTRSTTMVSTPLDDRKSESDASKAFSEGETLSVVFLLNIIMIVDNCQLSFLQTRMKRRMIVLSRMTASLSPS